MYIFGYGSLLWYQDFPYENVVCGKVKGFARRFWQLSPDHRGTPEQPGRTVTLVAEEGGVCWGMAFKVAQEHQKSTFEYLNHREKAGYTCEVLHFYPDDGSPSFDVRVYISDGNEFHAGPSEINEIAEAVVIRRGPSGTNLEYALRLADILRNHLPHAEDEHVFAVEEKCLELVSKDEEKKKLVLEIRKKADRKA